MTFLHDKTVLMSYSSVTLYTGLGMVTPKSHYSVFVLWDLFYGGFCLSVDKISLTLLLLCFLSKMISQSEHREDLKAGTMKIKARRVTELEIFYVSTSIAGLYCLTFQSFLCLREFQTREVLEELEPAVWWLSAR